MSCFKATLLALAALTVLCVVLGCGVDLASTASSPSDLNIRGNVHGGQQPVTGATIQLFAAGKSGYGSGELSLLDAPVITDSRGAFSLTGAYACPAQDSELYVVATGGNPGLTPGTHDAALRLTAALGICQTVNGQRTLSPSLFINLNEVTTVAAAYALTGFFSADAAHLGTSATNGAGLANAFNTSFNLVDLASGAALAETPANTAVVPQGTINALANLLSTCVNSDGTGTPCTDLFAAATPPGGTVPTNTLQAALSIAQRPTNNVTALYDLASATPPFQPTLTAPPSDWSLQLNFTQIGVNGGVSLNVNNVMAIDASGNLWCAFGPTSAGTSYVTEYANNGMPLSGLPGYATGINGPIDNVAIDPSGNLWVTMYASFSGDLVKLSASGTILATVPFPQPTYPAQVTSDITGDAWVSIAGQGSPNTVYKFDPNGSNVSGPNGFGIAGLGQPYRFASDSQGNVWTADAQYPNFAEFDPGGSVLLTNTSLGDDYSAPNLAIDNAGNLWFDTVQGSIYEFSSGGALLNGNEGYPYCNSVLNKVCSGSSLFALDGVGNAWVKKTYDDANRTFPGNPTLYTLSELRPDGSLLTGTGLGINLSIVDPGSLQIDNSGNLWLVGGPGGLLEVVGAATPVSTPFSLAAKLHKLAARP